MSFKATVYFNDADIYATKILAKNGVGVTLINETRYYGDAAYETIELADSTMFTFTATPADGCEFTKWYYRIGGDSGTLQDSTNNPFYYSGTEDIIIRAEGQPISGGGGDPDEPDEPDDGDPPYVALGLITISGYELVTDKYSSSPFYIERAKMHRFKFKFTKSGIATFYTSIPEGYSGVDTYGYLTPASDFNFTTYLPEGPVLAKADYYEDGFSYADDDGLSFSISHYVEANTEYHLWVRAFNGTDTGTVTINVIAPESSEKWSWSNKAYNAFLNKGNTKDVPYTEWNEFVKFVGKKTGYSVSTALMSASDTTLYATKFNTVRNAIGSVNTFMNGTNSIKEHYEQTGQWNMSSGEVVKGQYFIDLTRYLNNIT